MCNCELAGPAAPAGEGHEGKAEWGVYIQSMYIYIYICVCVCVYGRWLIAIAIAIVLVCLGACVLVQEYSR